MKKYLLTIIFITLLPTALFADKTVNAAENVDKMKRVRSIASENQAETTPSKWLNKGDDSAVRNAGINAGKMLQGLGLCLGLFFIFVSVIKKWNKGQVLPNEKSIQILEKIALTQKTSLILAKHNKKEILLAVGSDEVKLLSTSTYPKDLGNTFQNELTNSMSDQKILEEECQKEISLSA